MKYFIILLFAVAGCTANNATPTKPVVSSTSGFDASKATLLKSGMFVGLDGPTTGTASIYDQGGVKYVVLDPLNANNGPDLKVYLAKDINAKDYIRLGSLKSTTGKQSYAVPGTPTISDYNYVHIWCEAFSVDFARAEVK